MVGLDDYIIHGIPEADVRNVSLSYSHDVSYTLPANKVYSIMFEVFTAAEAVNVSKNTFCK